VNLQALKVVITKKLYLRGIIPKRQRELIKAQYHQHKPVGGNLLLVPIKSSKGPRVTNFQVP